MAFGLSGSAAGVRGRARAASRGVGLSGVRWWRVVGTSLARVLLVVGLGSLVLVWGGGSAFAAQSAPIPFGTPMDDGSVAVCSVGYVDNGPESGVGGPAWAEYVQYFAVCNADAAGVRILVHAPAVSVQVHGGDIVDEAQWGSMDTDSLGQWSGCLSAGFGTGYDCSYAMNQNAIIDSHLAGFCVYEGIVCAYPYGMNGFALLSSLSTASDWDCTASTGPCEIDTSVGVANGQPGEPYPYWAGQAATAAPYSAELSCSVDSFDDGTGAYSISATWGNALADPATVNTGVRQPYVLVLSGVADAYGVGSAYSLGNESSAPMDIVGGVGDVFTGSVNNPEDISSGGLYTFTVTAWIADRSGPPDPGVFMDGLGDSVGTVSCSTGPTNGVTPPGGTICPSGPGTCGDLSLCTLDDVTLTMPDGWLMSLLGGSAQSLTFPDPLAVPGWVGCVIKEAGEWAFLPTTTVLTSWQDFGSSAETHVPVVYLYDGSHWMFSFTNELHNQIPSNYVSTSCMSITPGSIPDGKGGSVAVGGGQLCGAGATLTGSDQVVAGSSDVEELLSILLVLGFAVGLVGISVHLLRSGGK